MGPTSFVSRREIDGSPEFDYYGVIFWNLEARERQLYFLNIKLFEKLKNCKFFICTINPTCATILPLSLISTLQSVPASTARVKSLISPT